MECQSDPEIIDRLRLVTKPYASGNAAPTGVVMMKPCIASSLHPSLLPLCFVAAELTPPTGWLTPHGTWKDCRWSYTAVRSGVVAAVDASSPAPCYVGVKRIFQFHHPNGANTGWKMVLYHALHNFVTQDEMTFCKVLFEPIGDRNISKKKKKFAAGKQPYNLGASSSSSPTIQVPAASEYQPPTFFDEFEKMMNDFNPKEHPIYGDMQMDGTFFPSLDGVSPILAGEVVQFTNNCFDEEEEEEEVVAVPAVSDGGRKRKKERSPAWEHFTKIRTNDHWSVYAACHLCDCMLKAHSKTDGTSTLNKHYKNHME